MQNSPSRPRKSPSAMRRRRTPPHAASTALWIEFEADNKQHQHHANLGKCRIDSASVTSRSPHGPIMQLQSGSQVPIPDQDVPQWVQSRRRTEINQRLNQGMTIHDVPLPFQQTLLIVPRLPFEGFVAQIKVQCMANGGSQFSPQ